jgi:hypothetical protein
LTQFIFKKLQYLVFFIPICIQIVFRTETNNITKSQKISFVYDVEVMQLLRTRNTVKPEYNDHPWDTQKVAVVQTVVVCHNFIIILAGLGI